MIPTVRVEVVTRSMVKKTNQKKPKETPEVQIDHLYAWEATSITEISNIKKLSFTSAQRVNEQARPEMKRIMKDEENYKNKTMHEDNLITVNKKEIEITYVKEKLNLESILHNLIKEMKIQNICNLALRKNDEIFKSVKLEKFKELFNKLQHKQILIELEKLKFPNTKEKNLDDYLINRHKNNLKIMVYEPPENIKNSLEQDKIIKLYHDSPHNGGHTGIKRTICKIKNKFIWKNLNKMVKNYVNNCDACLRNKQIRHIKEKLVITETPSTCFETISIDTVGPLTLVNGYRYILSIQCDLSKYIECVPMETKEAKTVAKALVEKIILKYGAFKRLKSDMGSEFLNETMKEVCKLLKIEHITSTPYHHETLGSIERNHRVLNEYLLSFTTDFNWDEWIPYFVFSYNTTPHTDTHYTPYELIFGKLASMPTEILNSFREPIYNLENYANELKFRLQQAHEKAQKLLILAKERRKQFFDKNTSPSDIKVGDFVLIKAGERKKSDPPYVGPYQVIETNGVNSKLKINNSNKATSTKIVHNNRLKMYPSKDKN